MRLSTTLSDFADRLRRIVQALPTAVPNAYFSELALELFALQRELNEPYGKLCTARGISHESRLQEWTQIPAVPTFAFKDLPLSCLAIDARTMVFYSSGTTQHRPSRHFHNSESLALYETSSLVAFSRRLDVSNRFTMVSLTPRRVFAPNSSLIHMFETFHERFGNDRSSFLGTVASDGGWTLNGEFAHKVLQRAVADGKPMLILGTAFLHVHLLDFLDKNDLSLTLPPGSHILETGGYKGRSRTIPKSELHELLCERFGISPTHIIGEYGMSELSSQAYDMPATRAFHFPPWTRVQIISPETGREANEGEIGLIRVFDLANVFSVMAIQTEDLGIRRGNGFELVGRASLAEARGCSLMAI